MIRYCGGCGNENLAINCLCNPNKTADMAGKTSLGLVEILSSPSISENEADTKKDVKSLRIVTQAIKGKESKTSNSRERESQVKRKTKQRRCNKSQRNKNVKSKEEGSSSESDSLESGSWEFLVLELPDGVRREFVVKKAKKFIGESTPISIANGEKQSMPVLVITRAHAKADELKESKKPFEESSEGMKQPKTRERPPKHSL